MNRLLIIVDMQEGFRDDNILKLVSSIRNLVMSFNGDVVFSCFENEKDSNFERVLNWKVFQNEYDRELLKELSDLSFKKFKHNTYSVFSEELFEFMEENEYDEILLCGVYTDVSIFYGAIDLFDLGIPVRVVSDCVTAQDGATNGVFLNSLKRVIGKDNVLNYEEVLLLE
ncbi:MAG: cysteine hydrolase [Candidatus Woesearchaeota archaeon]|jgi:nicotinamidase-related amidase|nr:cysteine hydrolase [Candidatus Woesearchaeota archaeon]